MITLVAYDRSKDAKNSQEEDRGRELANKQVCSLGRLPFFLLLESSQDLLTFGTFIIAEALLEILPQ